MSGKYASVRCPKCHTIVEVVNILRSGTTMLCCANVDCNITHTEEDDTLEQAEKKWRKYRDNYRKHMTGMYE